MFRLDQRGVAAVTVVVIIAISSGAAVATPVAVDVIDVDPDNPLYGLERLGERIRMVGGEDQMKERWGEYARLVDRGKGLEYKRILEEFVERMREVAPGDVAARGEVVRWMQEQMPGIGEVQLKLCKELCQDLREDLADLPEAEWIENCIRECENCERDWATSELRENCRARLRLIREKVENIAERYRARIHRPADVDLYFNIDNMLVDVDITVNVEVNITIVRPPVDFAVEFNEKLENFGEELAEVRAMLEGTPENTAGRHAAERLIELAVKLKERAVAAFDEGKVRRALGLIHAANVHLNNAERILEHAVEWEPDFGEEWEEWKQDWQELKAELIEGGTWENILQNWEQYAENVRQRWRERLLGT